MKNDYQICGNDVVILLQEVDGVRLKTVVDLADFERVNKFPNTWYAHKHIRWGTLYVKGNLPRENGRTKNVSLHRWLFEDNLALTQHIDHINHDTLDNRRSLNLRIVTNAQNGQNRKGSNKNSQSGIRGVSWKERDKKWAASVTVAGNSIHLGYFDNKEMAEKEVIIFRRRVMPFSTGDLK